MKKKLNLGENYLEFFYVQSTLITNCANILYLINTFVYRSETCFRKTSIWHIILIPEIMSNYCITGSIIIASEMDVTQMN